MKKVKLAVVFSMVALSAWSCSRTTDETVQTPPNTTNANPVAETATSELPDLLLTKINRSQISARDLKGKTILVYFDPDCDHCQRQAEHLKANMTAFDSYDLYFISSAPMAKMQKFAWDYKLNGPNINLAYATNENILRTFGPVQTPSIYIYSDSGKLVKAFNGETPLEKILPML